MGFWTKLKNKLSQRSGRPQRSQSSPSSGPQPQSQSQSQSLPQSLSQSQSAHSARSTGQSTDQSTNHYTGQQLATAVSQPTMASTAPKIAVVYYSLYGHIRTMALSVKAGIESAGGQCDLFQIPETLSEDVLHKMHAPAKSSDPVFSPHDLPNYDAYMFGIPTRYGNFPAQWKAFWDATGGLWAKGALFHKMAGVFVSTGTPGGGQELTALSSMSTLVHHGIIFVPLGYKMTFPMASNLEEVHGGSPWGAGTFAGADGSRQPTALEKEMAHAQGKAFYDVVSRFKFPTN